MSGRRSAALSGVAAVAAGVGAGEVMALLTGPLTSPALAVGGAIIDVVPEPLKHLAITLFGTYDKLALQVGMLVLLGLAGAGLGLLARRRPVLALAGVGVFAALGIVAAVTRYRAAPLALLPSLAAGVVGVLVLHRLTRAAGPHDRADLAAVSPAELGQTIPEEGAASARSTRRGALAIGGVVVVAGMGAAVLGRWISLRRDVTAERASVRLPQPASPAPPLPPEVDAGLPRVAPFVTSNPLFYRIDTALIVPQVSPDGWRLRIHGRVRNPLTLTYEDLLRRPTIERYITLCCVSNEVGGGLVGNARWLGVRVSDLLAEADPEPGADQVVSRSHDGYTAGTPTAVLRDGRDAMLAVGMNGEPLPIDHGFPVRMVVPGLYGYVSATKWLTELELTSFADYDAYWVRRGWAAHAPIKLQSRIDAPGPRAKAGTVVVGGVAWAQHVGVAGVELRADDGPWLTARLHDVPSVDTWRQWTVPWDATSGTHVLTVRARDASGRLQDEDERPVLPDGATGWHSVEVTVD
jgi:DMSO/TMAO reductase YedYZ molybdopterin-dependent catalytic subunit